MNHVLRLLLILIISIDKYESAKILGVFILCGKSHYHLGNSLMRGLAEAGNDITMISPFEDAVSPINGSYRNVVLTGIAEGYEDHLKRLDLFGSEDFNSISHLIRLHESVYSQVRRALNHPNFQNLLNSNEHFDAVIIEQFSNDAFQVLPHHFNSHYIAFSPVGPYYTVNNMVGNPTMTSYIPGLVTDFPRDMSLFQRTYNTLLHVSHCLLEYFVFLNEYDKLVGEYFPNAPSVYDSHYNASLVLLNSHESLGQPVPLVPNMINIGGFHIRPPKKLSDDLQRYLDGAESEVVLVSFGSNLRMHNMDKDKRNALVGSLGKLNQKVLWKWESECDFLLPANIKIAKWLPQMDILAHPNVKLFVTHGGLLSQAEAIYNGVPVLVIPVFGDQATNANNAVHDGYGLSISYHDPEFGEEKLSAALNGLLTEPKYRVNAKRVSRLYHDRPKTPMETAAYWVDYIIRHHGAPHLRVAALHLPWYRYVLLDVVGVIVISVAIVIVLVGFLLKCIFKKKFKLKSS